jgi:hypothetical protein
MKQIDNDLVSQVFPLLQRDQKLLNKVLAGTDLICNTARRIGFEEISSWATDSLPTSLSTRDLSPVVHALAAVEPHIDLSYQGKISKEGHSYSRTKVHKCRKEPIERSHLVAFYTKQQNK